MDRNQKRARDLLPSIIITVLSLIQAIALELYWSKIRSSDFLFAGGWDATLGWMQVVVMFMGMLLIWIIYVSAVLRFSWLPSMEDTLIPFYIGLMEFGMIDLMGPDLLGPWFILLAGIFALSTIANHLVMRRARVDPANDYFFRSVAAASWRDYLVSITVVLVLVLMGALLWVFEDTHILAMSALWLAFLALAYQFRNARRYWMHSMDVDNAPENRETDV